ncbi:MAG: hypothetical protein ACK4IZ_02280 [Flavobacterium sp.]|uniref:hypothetical protein n=1 Tax=Flavobacterium sp. TaxID=239 RepID=UPI00391C0DC8
MTNLSYNLPKEFSRPEYTFDLHLLLNKYQDSFDENLTNLVINIEMRIGSSSSQDVNHFQIDENIGTLTIPFKRYINNNVLSELPTPTEFFSAIKFALDTLVRDYNENEKEV